MSLTVRVPPDHNAGEAEAYIFPFPLLSGEILKSTVLHQCVPPIVYRRDGGASSAASRSFVVKSLPPIDSSKKSQSVVQRAAAQATVTSPFSSVNATLNAIAESNAAVPGLRRENTCIHPNLKGDITICKSQSTNRALKFWEVVGGGHTDYNFGRVPWSTLASTGLVPRIGHCAFWSPSYNRYRELRINRGTLQYPTTNSFGYQLFLPGLVACKTSTGGPVSKGSGTVCNYTVYGEGDILTRSDDNDSDFKVVLNQTHYNGGYGVYSWGEHYYYGGWYEYQVQVSVLAVTYDSPGKCSITWRIQRKNVSHRYASGYGDYTTSVVEDETEVEKYGYAIFPPGSDLSTDPELDYLYERDVRLQEALIRAEMKQLGPPALGTLVREAVEDDCKRLSANNIENLVQLSSMFNGLPRKLFSLVYHARRSGETVMENLLRIDPRDYTKLLGELYLEYRYVWKPTVKDAVELSKRRQKIKDLRDRLKTGPLISRKSKSVQYTRGRNTYDVRASCKVVMCRSQSRALTDSPYWDGFHPGLAQGWDLIPFSFVLDWALDVGGVLAELDWIYFRNMFNLHYILSSVRKECRVVPSRYLPFTGDMKVIDYDRRLSAHWPSFAPLFGERDNAGMSIMTAGTALIAANLDLSAG